MFDWMGLEFMYFNYPSLLENLFEFISSIPTNDAQFSSAFLESKYFGCKYSK